MLHVSRITLFGVLAALGILFLSFSRAVLMSGKKRPVKKTFVLVHGAFAGKYAWSQVAPMLEKEGNRVVVLDLPGHGDDTTSAKNVSFEMYVDAVVKAINAEPGKVILLGHSMGGGWLFPRCRSGSRKRLTSWCTYPPIFLKAGSRCRNWRQWMRRARSVQI